MQNNTNALAIFFVGVLLTGCTTSSPSPDLLTQELQRQAALINRQLPVSEEGIILVRATVNKHQMDLHLYQSNEKQNVENIIRHYAESLCQQPEVRQRIERGARYRIEWRDDTNKRLEQMLTTCETP